MMLMYYQLSYQTAISSYKHPSSDEQREMNSNLSPSCKHPSSDEQSEMNSNLSQVASTLALMNREK